MRLPTRNHPVTNVYESIVKLLSHTFGLTIGIKMSVVILRCISSARLISLTWSTQNPLTYWKQLSMLSRRGNFEWSQTILWKLTGLPASSQKLLLVATIWQGILPVLVVNIYINLSCDLKVISLDMPGLCQQYNHSLFSWQKESCSITSWLPLYIHAYMRIYIHALYISRFDATLGNF